VHAVFALYSIMNANRGGFGWVVWDEVAIEICSACWLADAVRPSSFVFRPVSFIILYLRINASFYAAHQVLRPAGFIHPWSYPLSPFSFLLFPFPRTHTIEVLMTAKDREREREREKGKGDGIRWLLA